MQTRVKLLGSTALAATAVVLGAPAANAAQHTSLEKRVMALEKAGGGMYVTRTKKTMNLVISGHINRAVVFTDNGTTSGITHVTSNFSRTRVRWIGTGKINDDLSVKTHIELGNQSSIGTAQDIQDNGDQGNNGNNTLDERHIEFQITSKSLGKIYMGQGISGSESSSEVDLSGTAIISLNGNSELIGGGNTFQRNGAGAGVGTVGTNFNNLDGLGRRDRLRYDTPKFAGFQITTSHGNSDAWDVALRYGGSFGGVKVKAAIAYWDQANAIAGRDLTGVNGSASVLLPFGLSLTGGFGNQNDDTIGSFRDDTNWRYGKIGYRFKGVELGETRLYVEYSANDDVGAANRQAEEWGLGVVQILEPLGAELYLSYTNWSLDIQGAADPDDIDQVALGARFKF
jgi:hypothetical protein